tara:strand:- start:162 stop:1073 length:912 start_codon:yes stop_codon:yes gene_type:complete
MSTKNKLPFLTYGLNRLVNNLQSDEEIVIIDAGSTDGTVDYLENLYQKGKIHQFITEPDFGEGHGFNKGVLLARGRLIKVVSDDDFFNYPAIQESKKVMLANKNIDVMIGNVYGTYIDDFDKIYCEDHVEEDFKNYLENEEPFPFTGLSLMIRKDSIALTGLFYATIICVDTEFALRITEIGVQIGWSSAPIAIRIGNPKSKLENMNKKNVEIEMDKFLYFYDSKYRNRKNTLVFIILRKAKSMLRYFVNLINWSSSSHSKHSDYNDGKKIYCSTEYVIKINDKCKKYISEINEEIKFILPKT